MGGLLDEVYERLRDTGPEFDGWLSNHGPMAADALLRLGPDSEVHVHRWVDRYRTRLEDAPAPRRPISPESWREAFGDATRLGDWPAFFDRELAERPWPDVLCTWWPRLLPGAVAAATHGLIRTGHAVRALREEQTPPRVAELAQALGYWAARWQPVPGDVPPRGSRAPGTALDALPVLGRAGDVRRRLADLGSRPDWAPAVAGLAPVAVAEVPAALDALVDAAVVRYGRWAHGNPVMLVHAATAPRAAALVLPSLPRDQWQPTFRAAWVTAAAITAAYRPAGVLPEPPSGLDPRPATEAALRSGDEHALKFAEVAAESAARGVPTAVGAAQRAAQLIGRAGG
jgi:hypothetical protein